MVFLQEKYLESLSIFSDNGKIAISAEGGGYTQTSLDDLKPIPLSEKELANLEFEYVELVMAFCNKDHFIYLQNDNASCFHPFCTNDKDCQIEVEYVHELQNLLLNFKKKVKK